MAKNSAVCFKSSVIFTILGSYIASSTPPQCLIPCTHSCISFLCMANFSPSGPKSHMPIMNICYVFKHIPLFPESFMLLSWASVQLSSWLFPLSSSRVESHYSTRVFPASWLHRGEEETWGGGGGVNHTVLRLGANPWISSLPQPTSVLHPSPEPLWLLWGNWCISCHYSLQQAPSLEGPLPSPVIHSLPPSLPSFKNGQTLLIFSFLPLCLSFWAYTFTVILIVFGEEGQFALFNFQKPT